jgi:peptidoglycan/xylan/chitin deacetylase (PgdA/CDA1 family)
MSAPRVAVLSFHKIGVPPPPPAGWESWFYIAEDVFVGYLETLRREGWAFLDLAAFLEGLAAPGTLPARSALLTFDDGYKSMRQIALPLLQRFAAPGVVFMPSDHIGASNVFDLGHEPEEPLCDWDDLRALEAGGVAVQSHGASHRSFSDLTTAERAAELSRSKAVLEEGLKRPVDSIAFPYGDAGPDADHGQVAAAGYRAAFLYQGGPVTLPLADPFRIERLAMGADSDLRGLLAP